MSLATFERLLAELPDLAEVVLQGLGEPLLTPDQVPMVRVATERGEAVGFNTNATLLTPRRARELVEAGLDWLCISLDRANAPTYEAIRDGATFDRVITPPSRRRGGAGAARRQSSAAAARRRRDAAQRRRAARTGAVGRRPRRGVGVGAEPLPRLHRHRRRPRLRGDRRSRPRRCCGRTISPGCAPPSATSSPAASTTSGPVPARPPSAPPC